jgi:hypothetical protein
LKAALVTGAIRDETAKAGIPDTAT